MLRGLSKPSNQDVVRLLKFKGELAVTEDGMVLRGSKILVPHSLQSRVLAIAHEGHQGIVKTKALLRTKEWFIGIDRATEKMVEECESCMLTTKEARPLHLA